MELENIVANSVYIKAKKSGEDKDKGRAKKWRTILAFDHILNCEYIADSIEKTFHYIVEMQPIGKRLFWIFCKEDSVFCSLIEMIDCIEQFMVSIGDLRASVHEQLMLCKSKLPTVIRTENLDLLLPDGDFTMFNFDKDSLNCLSRLFFECLAQIAFSEFLKSKYFDRYLQWKKLESAPVTKHTFRMYRVLGKGGFGEVCACQVRSTGKLYACKKMEKKRVKKRRGEQMALTEKQVLQKINSRFIVSLAYTFETKDALCLVLTIMNGGDLKFHIYNMGNEKGLGEVRARFYAAEIALGLEHMHSMNIIYRDLKPENILIDDQGHVRISDLGLAVELPPSGTVKARVGTAGYMAPEVLLGRNYSFSVDWFGFGCLVYEMLIGHSPFRKLKERPKRDEFDRRTCEDIEQYDPDFPEIAQSFCHALLHKDPSFRLGCDESGASSVKAHIWFSDINWARLEAGLEEPPFLPDVYAVYAHDVLDIDHFSTVRGIVLDEKDTEFYDQFCSGAISIPWQNEMIETGCFDELNDFYETDGSLISNLDRDKPPPPAPLPHVGLFHRFSNIFHLHRGNAEPSKTVSQFPIVTSSKPNNDSTQNDNPVPSINELKVKDTTAKRSPVCRLYSNIFPSCTAVSPE